MPQENAVIVDSCEAVVWDANGSIKDYRFIKDGWEFIPNGRYLKALNAGRTPLRLPIWHGHWQPVKQEN